MTSSSVRLTDKVQWASFSKYPPPFAKEVRKKGAKGRGIRYEKAVQAHLKELLGGWYVASPWIAYSMADQRRRWCQPDGLIIRPDQGVICIQETKLQHTAAAFFQLQDLYYPVLEKLCAPGLWSIRMLEICRWYDPAIPFPGPHHLRPHPYEVKTGEIGVLIWNPKWKKKGR